MPSNNFGHEFHGRQPSLSGYVDNLPSRHPSYTGSENSRSRTTSHTSPVKQLGYFDPSPSPPYSPEVYSRSRTTSHSSSARQGGFYDSPSPISPPSSTSGYGDPHAYRGRPGFVASPSQLAYSHVDLAYSSHVNDENPPPSKALTSPSQSAPPEDEFSKDLAGAWKSATTAPKVTKTDQVLQVIGRSFVE